MQKTGAFAFASLWMMMWVAPSVAAAGIELYGVADAFVKFGEWRGDQTVGVDDSWFSGDRIGLRGKESLGDGLVATFVLEQGYALDTGKSEVMSREDSLKNEGSEVLTRQAWVGLEGAFGRVGAGAAVRAGLFHLRLRRFAIRRAQSAELAFFTGTIVDHAQLAGALEQRGDVGGRFPLTDFFRHPFGR